MAKETRSFTMHPHLLLDVMQRQAGTLSKAILEGIMNAVDAKATRCDLVIDADHMMITDDGQGFRNRIEIEQWFEKFGNPHVENEKKTYGSFRMGRGQIFSFGKNLWKTGVFRMEVDIKERGLDYDLISDAEDVNGCSIDVNFYKKLLPLELADVIRDVEKTATYVPIVLTINGRVVSVDPATEKWDFVTEEAYIRLRSTISLSVYNLGVWVKDFGNWQLGCGGTIVSRKQLTLNFARNDIMVQNCEVWRKIKKLVDKKSTSTNCKKTVLDDGERQRLANQMLSGELDIRQSKFLKLFTDVTGKYWSADQLARADMARRMTVAVKGERRGDALMQSKVLFVMAEETLDRFHCRDIESLITIIKRIEPWWNPTVVKFEDAAKGMGVQHFILDQKKWTAREKVFISILKSCDSPILLKLSSINNSSYRSYDVISKMRREIVIGTSDSALAWTDGSTYIAFARGFLKKVEFNMLGMMNLFDVALHEYCHEDADSDTHIHSGEFYQKFHDACTGSNESAIKAFGMLPNILETHGNRLNRTVVKDQNKIEKVVRAIDSNPDLVAVAEEEKSIAAIVESIEEAKVNKVSKVRTNLEGNPFRLSSNYGILFKLGHEKYWVKQELLEAVAQATSKSLQLVANDLAVLSNPKHKSNGNRSEVVKDDLGRILIQCCV